MTDRSLLYIAAGVMAIVVAAIAVVLVAAPREATSFPAGAPEQIVQRYLEAHESGDREAAYALFSSDVQERMSLEAYEQAADAYGPEAGGATRGVTYDRTSGSGDRRTVHLTVEEFYGQGLDASSYTYPHEVRLVQEAGEWRIAEALVWLDPAPVEGKP